MVIAFLCLIIAALLVYIFRIKNQLREISGELDKTYDNDYNRLVTVSLFDKDINRLASSVNMEIERQKQLKIDKKRTEESMRRAVSDIAHDLRTPLSVIKGNLQLIKMNADLNSESRHYIDICITKTDELKSMSDSFFELAVMESDTSKAELKKLNLTNILMKFIAENEGLIRVAGLEPDIILPPKTVFAMGDEELLIRILGNLLGNVVKYSCGTFRLELFKDGRITMSNPVLGGEIPDVSRLFDRAYRGSSSRQGCGAGLGLHIVKLLSDKIDSEVSAEYCDGNLSIILKLKDL